MHQKEKEDGLLNEILTFISKHTGAKHVLVGKVINDGKEAETLLMLEHGNKVENFTYPLAGTPCDEVIIQRFCYHATCVADMFPDDEALRELNIQSYMGCALINSDNDTLGILALMHDQELAKAAFSEHLLQLFSPAIEDALKQNQLVPKLPS